MARDGMSEKTPGCGGARDLAGMRFGSLVALRRVEGTHEHGGEAFWLCRCDCGEESVVRSDHLTGGHTRSCGCCSPFC